MEVYMNNCTIEIEAICQYEEREHEYSTAFVEWLAIAAEFSKGFYALRVQPFNQRILGRSGAFPGDNSLLKMQLHLLVSPVDRQMNGRMPMGNKFVSSLMHCQIVGLIFCAYFQADCPE